MHELGKGLIVLSAVLLAVGLLLVFANKAPSIGKLPGDILFKRGNFTFSFPLATGIIVSVIISLVLFLIGRFR